MLFEKSFVYKNVDWKFDGEQLVSRETGDEISGASMAYDCRTYRLLIASPSDVEDEREIAVRVIQEWNDLYSYSQKVVLLPLRWETHAAPDYNTRPQEIINRAIVDDCDLLIGIFWTRIGSPTGLAESGTQEEIERVGKAGKPIMLYFSNVPIDPDRINSAQIDGLREFKKKTFPHGLVESYKTHVDFRDKLSRQLELKIRELRQSDQSRTSPVSLEFVSKDGLKGSQLQLTIDHFNVPSFEDIPKEKRELVMAAADAAIRARANFPIALGISNSSSSGIRNLYVELRLRGSSNKIKLSVLPFSPNRRDSAWTRTFHSLSLFFDNEANQAAESAGQLLAKFEPDKLLKTEEGWMLAFEWDAAQPQRIRLIQPIIYGYSPESCSLSIEAKIFADSFPTPVVLEAILRIEANQKSITAAELVPDWDKLEERTRLTPVTTTDVRLGA